MWLRILESHVRVGRISYQETLIRDVRFNKQWQGSFRLLEAMFKDDWGKDAPAEAPLVSEMSSADWDEALETQLQDENSELCGFLRKHGFTKV
jgi:hypothetical protein